MALQVSMYEAKKRKSRSKSGIAGSKPAPLKVSKDSQKCTKIQPLIIYLRSPETIHTQAKDFKAVVQRLTGCSSSSTLPREDFTALQTNPNPKPSFRILEKEEEEYQISPAPPVWPNDYFFQVISPPWNSLAEDLESDMIWDAERQLLSWPSLQLLDSPLTELQPFNYLCENIYGVSL